MAPTFFIFQAEYKITTGRHLCLGLQRKASFSLVISLGLVTAFMGMVYLKGVILHWWQYIVFIFVISITVLLPFIWIFTCVALTKVAIELADDIEKVRNLKYCYLHVDTL
jgi:hypothetical protein